MKKLLLWLVVIILLAGGFYLFKWWANGIAGGGGSEQIAPDTVKAGEPAKISLKLSVWGGSGQIQNRYKDIFLYYQITGEDLLGQLTPKLISQDDKSQTYEFSIPTNKDSGGEITYSFEFKFDGQTNRIDGMKKIKITNTSTATSGNNTAQASDKAKSTSALQTTIAAVCATQKKVSEPVGQAAYVPGEVVVSFDQKLTPSTAQKFLSDAGFQMIEYAQSANAASVKVPVGEEQCYADQLSNQTGIQSAIRNYYATPQ